MPQDSFISFDCKNSGCYIRKKVTYCSDLRLVVPVVIHSVVLPTLNPHDRLPARFITQGSNLFLHGGNRLSSDFAVATVLVSLVDAFFHLD